MTLEAKHIKGHGGGSRMNWLCVRNVNEEFGFGDRPAIICIDMTVHAPEVGKPNTVFSTYEEEDIDIREMKYKFHPSAFKTWEQLEFGRRIITGWKDIKSGDEIEIYQSPFFRD
jgi:hypothetical protein